MALHRRLGKDGKVIEERQVAPIGRPRQVCDARTPGKSRPEPPWRVLFMSPCWHRGGLETVTITHIRKLNRELFEPVLLVGSVREMDDSVPEGVEFHVDMGCFEFYGHQGFDEARKRSREVLAELKPDVVIGQLCHAGLFAANDVGVPVIIEYWHVGRGHDAREHPSDVILSVSHATTLSACQAGRRPRVPVKLVYNGIDEGRFRRVGSQLIVELRQELGFGEQDVVMGWSGRIAPEKCPKGWVNILGELRRRGHNVRGLMVGTKWCGRTYSKMRARAQRVGLEWGVDVVHRSVAYDEMPAYYSAMDLLVHTRPDEPFGMILPEALMCGTRVVGFAGGGMPEIADRVPVADDMQLVKPWDWHALAAATEDALSERIRAQSDDGLLARMFGARAMVRKLETTMLEMLQ